MRPQISVGRDQLWGVGGAAQQVHSLIKLTNIVNLYHSLAVFTSINWVDISDTAEENDIKPVVAFIVCNARLTIIIPLGYQRAVSQKSGPNGTLDF